MAITVTIDLRHVARGLNIPLRQVQPVVELLDEGNTVPFITRYRKDQTGGLDEEQIRQIQTRLAKLRLLAERKQTILRSIEAQDKLTEELAKQILAAGTTKRLEDLYLPYKPKKQTLATLARSRGLEPLAREILEADPLCTDLDARAADYMSIDRPVPTPADALLGAGHILAEQFGENPEVRQRLREILQVSGKLVSTRIGGEPKDLAGKADRPAGSADFPSTPGNEEKAEQTPESRPEGASESPPEGASDPTPAAGGKDAGDAEPAGPGETADRPASTEAEVKKEAQPSVDAAEPEKPSEAAAAGQAGEAAPKKVKALPKKAADERKQQRLSKKELKKKQAEEKKVKEFHEYFDYREEIKKIPPHRVLRINRGERAKVLRVKVECDVEAMQQAMDELLVPPEHPHAEYLRGCAHDALSRLILPALEREVRRELTDRAETHAVSVFARNLRNLLLQPPVRNRRVLAVDPGFKSGCKLAALDQFGNMLAQDVIYLIGRPERRTQAEQKIVELVRRFQLSVVVIGNGTACRECEKFFSDLLAGELKDQNGAYVIQNEAGASVYSTSRIGREEFPDYDPGLRSSISIGRRLQDPLSELVKIDPANIGVGLYQHDVKAKHLRDSLDEVVESCVNYVGVDVNTASPALLRYVSGLNQLTARRIYEHRMQHGPFRRREQLKEVAGLGETTFVQAAGFLKIAGGDTPLDSTWIHPESYDAAARVLGKLECSPTDLTDKEKAPALAGKTAEIDLEEVAKELEVGTLTLKDILAQLVRPGRDPREDLPPPVFKQGIVKLEDLTPEMELTGTVLNVVDFGAFVDIGMHDSGLVHVSQLADKFVRDPHEVVAVGDIVKVWVIEVDKERRRVSLTMIKPGSQRPRYSRPGEKPTDVQQPPKDRDTQVRQRQKPEDARRSRPKDRPGGHGPPKGKRPPRGKGPARGRGSAPPKYRPQSRPKPVIPITEAMKTGTEPMRTFGDLAQFFHHQKGDDEDVRHEKPPTAMEGAKSAASLPAAQDVTPGVPDKVTAPKDKPEETSSTHQEVEATKDESADTSHDPAASADEGPETTERGDRDG
ncbi:MAG TPA: Tex-like N-terminal domain-containing protein [Thermoguttaceae bacterium]|nr:Tex-like N-terminal domain-containing protein [Thermoguttaceae bacterium]